MTVAFTDLLQARAAHTHVTHRAPAGLAGAARAAGPRVSAAAGSGRRHVTSAALVVVAGLLWLTRTPTARAAAADVRVLAGYWPGLAGLACLVRAAAEFGPAAGWAAAGVALLLVGAVARA